MGNDRVPGPLNTEDRPLDVNDGTNQRAPGSLPRPSGGGATALSEGGGTEVDAKKHTDSRIDDDNFVLCLALTYIGLPPAAWRSVVSFMLEATREEYKEQLGEAKGSAEYEKFKTEFKAYSAFNMFRKVVVFLADGTVGPAGTIYIKNARAVALRASVIRLLERAGIRMTVIEGASQIVRRVSLYLELVYLSDCAAFCAATIGANTITEFSVNALSALATATQGVADAANMAVSKVLVRPVLVARAMLDATNWDTTPMPSGALVVRLLGNSLFAQLKPDDAEAFLPNLSKPISSFNIPASTIAEAAAAMTKTVQTRDAVRVVFTPQLIEGMMPLSFVQLLKEWRLIRFVKDPVQIADSALSKKS